MELPAPSHPETAPAGSSARTSRILPDSPSSAASSAIHLTHIRLINQAVDAELVQRFLRDNVGGGPPRIRSDNLPLQRSKLRNRLPLARIVSIPAPSTRHMPQPGQRHQR